ncbi:hypothetical protein PIB30_112990, partial [Stylosanthes scabra]|nr:hypothetical protein [Stylosanthes scabra]
MRRRFWKRKPEPEAVEPPEDESSVVKSSENNSVRLLEGSGSANNDFRAMNSEFRPVNSGIRPPRNDFPGSD